MTVLERGGLFASQWLESKSLAWGFWEKSVLTCLAILLVIASIFGALAITLMTALETKLKIGATLLNAHLLGFWLKV